MIQMEIDIKTKTIKIKDNIKLSDLQKVLSETLINWQDYTLIPDSIKINWNYPKPYTWIQPTYNPYYGIKSTISDSKKYISLIEGPTKL